MKIKTIGSTYMCASGLDLSDETAEVGTGSREQGPDPNKARTWGGGMDPRWVSRGGGQGQGPQ